MNPSPWHFFSANCTSHDPNAVSAGVLVALVLGLHVSAASCSGRFLWPESSSMCLLSLPVNLGSLLFNYNCYLLRLLKTVSEMTLYFLFYLFFLFLFCRGAMCVCHFRSSQPVGRHSFPATGMGGREGSVRAMGVHGMACGTPDASGGGRARVALISRRVETHHRFIQLFVLSFSQWLL